jgi:hypothetical protein
MMTEDDKSRLRIEAYRRYNAFPRRFRGLTLEGVDEDDLNEDDLMADYVKYIQYLMR